MTPGARVSAVIEIIEKIDRSCSPSDKVITSYLRGRRYIGSKDRRYITETTFSVLRHTAHLNFWTKAGSARERLVAYLAGVKRISEASIEKLFDGKGYSPPPLNSTERNLASSLLTGGHGNDTPPLWVQTEFPEWLTEAMETYWANNFGEETEALNKPAPVDLRVNTLKADCGRALQILKNDGLEANPTPYSPVGLRLTERRNLQPTTAFKGGFVEIQDEGSQIIALLTDAKADHKTIDFCAGAGGKTLALAAAMKDGGPLLACDTDKARLDRLTPRLKRAGISNISRHTLLDKSDGWYEEHKQSAARVLIDVPCSGSGAWRRAPASKWRLTCEKLEEYRTLQSSILDQASGLVAPGGRLIYATCSVLPQENEIQISAFLERSATFRTLPVSEVWQETIGDACPSSGPYLHLTPARTQTDGFFCAILERLS